MFSFHSTSPERVPETQIKVIHLEKIPVKFLLDKKNQSFLIKLNKLNRENTYEKIEFDFENELILVQNSSDSTIFSIDFPFEFKERKSMLIHENFNWDTTNTQIIISYKSPPQVIVIDENSENSKKKIITIEDSDEFLPNIRSRGIRVINDMTEIENSLNYRSMDKDGKKIFEKTMKIVMKNIEREFPPSIPLKKSQMKKLAELLIEKNFDSYDKALEKGYSYDISKNTLEKALPENHRYLDNEEFNEIKGYNNIDQALNELDEADKHFSNKKKNSTVENMRRRTIEKQWNIYLEQHGADEKDLKFGDEKEFEGYEIKKKNSVYIMNENKFKTLFSSKSKENFKENKKNVEAGQKIGSMKRKRNVFISDDEVFL